MLIEFSELDPKLLVILIFPLFYRADEYTSKLYLKDDNFFFTLFINYISYILSFIFLLISYYKRRPGNVDLELTNENKDNNKVVGLHKTISNEINRVTKKINKRKKIKGSIYLTLLCAIGLLSYLYIYFFGDNDYKFVKRSFGILFEIIVFVLLSYLLLKQKLYLHNYICLIGISLSLIIIFILTLIYAEGQYILRSLLYYFIYSFIFSFYDVFGKKYMNDIYATPYFMMFVIGIVISILIFIYDIFAYNYKPEISGIIFGFQNNIKNVGHFFAFILHIIVTFIWNLGIWLTVYYFTPCHYFISESISEYVKFWKDIEKYKEIYPTFGIVIISILYLINFFFFLIFNEVIILNFCNLDYNTKKRIRERTKFDAENIKKEIPLININTDDTFGS